MDSNFSTSSRLFHLLLCSLLLVRTATSQSVLFIDSPNQSYLRSPSTDAQSELLSLHDVANAVSVLLGFPPSHSISASSATKLNDILAPSPFNRPRAVLLLEITGVTDHLFQSRFTTSLNRKIIWSVDCGDLEVQCMATYYLSIILSFGFLRYVLE